MSAPAFRFLYRRPGGFGWHVLSSSHQRYQSDAQALVKDWNRRDKGRWEWTYQICWPTDFDHPLRKKGGAK